MATHIFPPKQSDSKYFAVVAASAPDKPTSFVFGTIDDKHHVRVFISKESATTYRDKKYPGLSIRGWDSLEPLAIQAKNGGDKIVFMMIETLSGTVPAFETILIDDFLK